MNNYSIIIIVGGHSSNDCLLAWQPELLQLSTVMYSGIVHLQYSQYHYSDVQLMVQLLD